MIKKLYIIWNIKEDRPAIMVNNYGSILAYLTKEQAQAYQSQYEKEEDRANFIIKEINMVYDQNVV